MTKLEELKEKGCCILEGILDKNLTDHCIRVSHEALNNLTPEHRIKNKSQGSMIHIGDYPKFSKLIGSSSLIQSLIKNFNFSDIRFSSGYLISKPAKSPPLFWHQDWWC